MLQGWQGAVGKMAGTNTIMASMEKNEISDLESGQILALVILSEILVGFPIAPEIKNQLREFSKNSKDLGGLSTQPTFLRSSCAYIKNIHKHIH